MDKRTENHEPKRMKRLQRKPAAFERRVEAGVAPQRRRIYSAQPSNDSPGQHSSPVNPIGIPSVPALEIATPPQAARNDRGDDVAEAPSSPGQPVALPDPASASPEDVVAVSGPELTQLHSSSVEEIATPTEPALSAANVSAGNAEEEDSAKAFSSLSSALHILQAADRSSPKALRLLADLAELAELARGGAPIPQPRASHLIQPSGGGVPAPDLRAEYERRLGNLRPGDVAGLLELKREFRKRGLEVW